MSASILALVRAEASKLTRHRSAWTLAAILIGYLAIIAIAFSSLLRAPEIEGFDRDAFVAPMRAQPIAFATSLFSSTATILVIIFAAMLIGHEHSRATLRTLLLAGATRRGFVAAKLATLLWIALALAILGCIFAFGAVALFEAALDEDLASPSTRDVLWSTLGLFGIFAGWSLLAAWATLWNGSLPTGVGSTIALLIVGDVLAGLLAGAGDIGIVAGRLLPNGALAALASPRAPSATTWAWIVPNLAFWLGLAGWLTIQRFQRADIVALTRR